MRKIAQRKFEAMYERVLMN